MIEPELRNVALLSGRSPGRGGGGGKGGKGHSHMKGMGLSIVPCRG